MAKKRLRTKKKTSKITLPEVVLLVTCDSVARDPNSGKATLYGVFEQIAADKFPTTVNHFHLFAQLSGDGKHAIAIERTSPDGTVENLGEAMILVKAKSLAVVDVMLASLVFKKPGVYEFGLTCDGRRIGHPRRLNLVRIPKKRG